MNFASSLLNRLTTTPTKKTIVVCLMLKKCQHVSKDLFNNYFRNCCKTSHSLQEFKVYLTKKIGQKAPHLDTCENFDFQSF